MYNDYHKNINGENMSQLTPIQPSSKPIEAKETAGSSIDPNDCVYGMIGRTLSRMHSEPRFGHFPSLLSPPRELEELQWTIHALPSDVFSLMALSPQEVVSLKRASKRMQATMNADVIWEKLFRQTLSLRHKSERMTFQEAYNRWKRNFHNPDRLPVSDHIYTFQGQQPVVWTVGDDKLCFVQGADTLIVHDLATKRESSIKCDFPLDNLAKLSIRDGRLFVVASDGNGCHLQVFDLKTRQRLHTFVSNQIEPIDQIEIMKDQIFLRSPQKIHSLQFNEQGISYLYYSLVENDAFAVSERYKVCASESKLHILDIKTGIIIKRIPYKGQIRKLNIIGNECVALIQNQHEVYTNQPLFFEIYNLDSGKKMQSMCLTDPKAPLSPPLIVADSRLIFSLKDKLFNWEKTWKKNGSSGQEMASSIVQMIYSGGSIFCLTQYGQLQELDYIARNHLEVINLISKADSSGIEL